jgi:hypothetical protein
VTTVSRLAEQLLGAVQPALESGDSDYCIVHRERVTYGTILFMSELKSFGSHVCCEERACTSAL